VPVTSNNAPASRPTFQHPPLAAGGKKTRGENTTLYLTTLLRFFKLQLILRILSGGLTVIFNGVVILQVIHEGLNVFTAPEHAVIKHDDAAFLDLQAGFYELVLVVRALLASEHASLLVKRATTALVLVEALGDVQVVLHLLVAEEDTVVVAEGVAALDGDLCGNESAAVLGAFTREDLLAVL